MHIALVDLFVLDRVFEPLYRFIHRHTTLHNLVLGRFLNLGGLSLGLVAVAVSAWVGVTQFAPRAIVVAIALATFSGNIWGCVHQVERNYPRWMKMSEQGTPPNFRTPIKVQEAMILGYRSVLLAALLIVSLLIAISPLFLILLSSNLEVVEEGLAFAALQDTLRTCFVFAVSGLVLLVAGLYFISCTAPPPRRQDQEIQETAPATP